MDTLKFYAWDTAKTTGAIMAVSATGLPKYISNMLPSNKLGAYTGAGVSFALARDLVDQLTSGTSNLGQMNYVGLLDDTAFFGIANGLLNETNLNVTAYNAVASISPFDKDRNVDLVAGLSLSGATAVANLLDVSTGNNMLFDFVRRPVSTTYRKLTGMA